jgi:hypothetical protein
MPVPLNPNLTPANLRPGVYVSILLNASSSGDGLEPNTVLCLGELISGGTAAPDAVYDITSEQDAIDRFVRASTVHRQVRAVISQAGEGNVRIKAVGVTPSGVAATYRIVCTIPTTNPTAASAARIQVCGEEVTVGWSTTDTASTIATALKAQLDLLTNVPFTFGVSSETITATYNVTGAVGEDAPIRCYQGTGGVYFGPGAVVYATNATGAGSVKLACGTQTASATTANGDTPTVIATAMKAALAAGDYFVTGGTVAVGTLPLYYRDGRDVRRIAASVVTSTGTTATMTGGSATDGTGSASSFSYSGTQGTGLPTLTTALTNITNAGSFGEWTCPWPSAGSSSTGLSAIATQIEADANGEIQKNQHLTVCSVGTETVAAAIAAACSPALTTSTRYIIGFCPDGGQQGYELAARRAAEIAAWSTPATNSDGLPFISRAGVPLNFPALAVRPSNGTIKASILDGLEAWLVEGGRLVVERGRNTSNADEQDLWDPSYIRQIGLYRREVRSEGNATFAGTFIKADGVVTQSNEIDIGAIERRAASMTAPSS